MFPTTSFEHVFVRIDSKQYLGGFYTKGDECGEEEEKLAMTHLGSSHRTLSSHQDGIFRRPSSRIPNDSFVWLVNTMKWKMAFKINKENKKNVKNVCIENAVFESFEEKITVFLVVMSSQTQNIFVGNLVFSK